MTTTVPTLSKSICALLRVLARNAPADGGLYFQPPRYSTRMGPGAFVLPATMVSDVWIPTPLLTLFETNREHWQIGLAVRRGDAPVQLDALVCVFAFEKEYFNPEDPGSSIGCAWLWPNHEIAATLTGARAVLEPTCVVDARNRITLLWALREPLPLAIDSDRATALSLLQRLATAVGAIVPTDDTDLASLAVALPGFPISSGSPNDPPTTCPLLDVDRTYSLDDIKQAISTKPDPTARRTRK